jgi:P-type Ca2+ transporter type 2C
LVIEKKYPDQTTKQNVRDASQKEFHSLEKEDSIDLLQSDLANGISELEAENRFKIYGPNSIDEEKKRSVASIIIAQFKSPIVILLLIASGLSGWFGDMIDAVAILIVLLINAGIGFYMEFQAEKAMTALKKLTTATAKVIRDGKLVNRSEESLVPGDLVFVEAGDIVPADGRIIKFSQLQTDESTLTGESVPVEKHNDKVHAECILAERNNMLYKGTHITKGNGCFVVAFTGMKTELGKVAGMVMGSTTAATPLEQKLEEFSKKLIRITVVLVVLVFISGLIYGQKIIQMLETSIALAVAAIPEGLPIVATLALARGMIRMAKQNVIVKKLSAVETLGGTTVICTDKTGTLTSNKIEVAQVIPTAKNAEQKIIEAMVLCNTAEIHFDNGKEKDLGDPLEIGLLLHARSVGADIDGLRKKYFKIGEEPFSSETKIMSTVHKFDDGEIIFAKGAIEDLLNQCTYIADESGEKQLNGEERSFWIDGGEKLAASGLKTLATAYKFRNEKGDSISSDLIFTGLIGMIDPPRKDVPAAIDECRSAGIKVVMITGDHVATARNIAQQLRIVTDEKACIMPGKEMKDFEQLTDKEKQIWSDVDVFARVTPKQKSDIVKVLQENKNVVAMTGDGINDAPAMKKSDIGIAMGQRGSQVAQEVADMVLKDDSFSSIVFAIKEGRIIFENIKKFIIYLLSCNLSELLVISTASIFNLHFQLFPLQILFINIITDVLPALALGVTEGSDAIMKEKPRKMSEPIINKKRWIEIFVYSVVLGITSVGAVLFSHYIIHDSEAWNKVRSNNILFLTLIFSQLLHVLNMGSGTDGFFRSEVFKNKFVWWAIFSSSGVVVLSYFIQQVANVLNLAEVPGGDWMCIMGFCVVSVVVIQIFKRIISSYPGSPK